MIDFSLDATILLVWGILAHLAADFLLQSEWMAVNKAKRRRHYRSALHTRWWDRHPSAYAHAGIHFAVQLLVFPVWAALLIGVAHFFIDLRWPVEWWSKLIRQTQPEDTKQLLLQEHRNQGIAGVSEHGEFPMPPPTRTYRYFGSPLLDIGAEVRIWVDQVIHFLVIAFAALLVG